VRDVLQLALLFCMFVMVQQKKFSWSKIE